jgi:type III secretion system low calcium response chaperone LcrH/SycD
VLYAQAYNYDQTGRYKDAAQLFRLLILLNANESKYSMGFAACMHMMKEYDNAIRAYTMCSILEPESPIPYYHMSDCLLEMKDKLSAVVALEMTISRARDKEQYKIIKDRATITLNHLKEELLEHKNKL